MVAVAAALVCMPTAARAAGSYNVNYYNGNGCGLFTASPGGAEGYGASTCETGELEIFPEPGGAAPGSEENISTTAPAGITITNATADFTLTSAVGSHGWGAGDFYAGGGQSWNLGNSPSIDSPIASGEWGFQLLCNNASSNCPITSIPPESVAVSSVEFVASESQAPALSAPGPSNLFNNTTGYVWNPAGDPWSIATSGSDPSGTCNITAVVNGQSLTLENQSLNQYAWQQCANGTWPGSVDMRQFVAGDGPLSITLQGTNAAGNTSSVSQTVQVDNDPVSLSLATPNDANPTVWVNHAVQVTASPSAGPSGISGTSCAIDGAPSFANPDGGFTVDGDGTHTISCTASNNAVDPQGAHNTGTATQAIKIDEAPPALSFAPVNPADPDALTVNTSDSESGVVSGSITVQGPHAAAPQALATTLSGSQLLSRFNDGGKNGDYTFTATSCDAVGNCASTSEVLHFPIRVGSRSLISFKEITTPAKTIHKRILVGAHHRTIERRERLHGRSRRVKRTVTVGGHLRRVRIHVRAGRRCGHRTIRVRARRHHHRRRIVACRKLSLRTVTHHRQRLGRKVKVYGLLRTQEGQPLAAVQVVIATRPDDRGGRYHRVLSTMTDAHGRWSVKLRGGPSRTIRARYLGSAVVEPATVRASLTVPAGIRMRITPHVLPWSHTMHVRGHLIGRYVPHDGVALRLLVHYPHAHGWTVLQALRTNRHGAFRFGWNYHGGRAVARYPFRIASTSRETDYPYAAGASKPVRITFGRATPHHHRYHRRRHHHHHG
jgi:hypothetical protein